MTTRGARRWTPRDLLVPSVLAGAFLAPALLQAGDVLWFGETWSWREAALRSAFFAVVMAVFSSGLPRFSSAARGRAAVERAVTAGTLPEDVDEEWRVRLTAERHRLRSDRAGMPGVSALVAVFLAAACLQPRGPGSWGWVYVVVLLGVGVVLGLSRHRRMRTAQRLSAELEERLAHA